jgi:hypothetical protein
MSYELDRSVPESLRRWQQTGAPFRWVEAHQGQWTHQDWLDLLTTLHWSGHQVVPVEVVGLILEDARTRWGNLQRWQHSGEALRWVEAQRGAWNHHDWLCLLARLERSGYWPIDGDALGRLLEGMRTQWWNLQRWQESGQARLWVEMRGGQWNHHDWLALLDMLRRSEFWPVDPEQVGRVVETIRLCWFNLRRWRESGEAICWVESHRGEWNHDDWLMLMQGLQLSEYGPLDPVGVGGVVEEAKRQFLNLQRWLDSGEAWQWVQEHQGQSTAEDLRTLLRALQHSEYGPIDPVSVAGQVRQLELEWANLQRWQESGEPRKWVEDHQGEWNPPERERLLEVLRQSDYWPLNQPAIEQVLEQHRLEWWNLRRWQRSGLAQRWLEMHRGGRDRHDWLALLDKLRQSDFWPIEIEALRQVVEEFRPALTQAA